jgi:hypothetical protein
MISFLHLRMRFEPRSIFCNSATDMLDHSEKPELIATLQAGSTISGECSICHEVTVVNSRVTGTLRELNDVLKQAFEEHVLNKHCRASENH